MHQFHYKKPLFSGKGNTSSVSGLNNCWEGKINGVHFTCPLGFTASTPQDFDRKWTVLPFCSSFPCHLYFCFLNFSSLVGVLLRAFLTEFYFKFRILYPIVSFCVNDIIFISIHGRRGSCGHLLLYALRFMLFGALLWYALFLWKKWLLRDFSPFLNSWHGIIYIW